MVTTSSTGGQEAARPRDMGLLCCDLSSPQNSTTISPVVGVHFHTWGGENHSEKHCPGFTLPRSDKEFLVTISNETVGVSERGFSYSMELGGRQGLTWREQTMLRSEP